MEQENVHRLLDKLMTRPMKFLAKVCVVVGDVVDNLKFGDNLGTNIELFFSAETYHDFFQNRHKQMCDYVKANSLAHTMLHYCGSIYELIPELLDAGFEIINPVQVNGINMKPERIKREFGRDLTFWGRSCNTKNIQHRVTPQDVKDELKHNLEIFKNNGGLVFKTIQRHHVGFRSGKRRCDVRGCKGV